MFPRMGCGLRINSPCRWATDNHRDSSLPAAGHELHIDDVAIEVDTMDEALGVLRCVLGLGPAAASKHQGPWYPGGTVR